MLQQDQPDDYVLATGVGHSVQEFVKESFEHVGLDWERYVRFDERYLRTTEVDALLGDAAKAARELGWKAGTSIGEVARILVAPTWPPSSTGTALDRRGAPLRLAAAELAATCDPRLQQRTTMT